jgi:hypothetical protein
VEGSGKIKGGLFVKLERREDWCCFRLTVSLISNTYKNFGNERFI